MPARFTKIVRQRNQISLRREPNPRQGFNNGWPAVSGQRALCYPLLLTFSVPVDGRLYLAINDDDELSQFRYRPKVEKIGPLECGRTTSFGVRPGHFESQYG